MNESISDETANALAFLMAGGVLTWSEWQQMSDEDQVSFYQAGIIREGLDSEVTQDLNNAREVPTVPKAKPTLLEVMGVTDGEKEDT